MARAHLLALHKVRPGEHDIYNLGNGDGYSNRQIADTVCAVTGIPLQIEIAARRPGDASINVAAAEKARSELGWRPRWPSIADIVAHAWEFTKTVAA